jgi:hypothetical protein
MSLHAARAGAAVQLVRRRSARDSAFHGVFTYPWLWRAVAISALLQVYMPLLQGASGTTALAAADWALCGAVASTMLAEEPRELIAMSGLLRTGARAR